MNKLNLLLNTDPDYVCGVIASAIELGEDLTARELLMLCEHFDIENAFDDIDEEYILKFLDGNDTLSARAPAQLGILTELAIDNLRHRFKAGLVLNTRCDTGHA